MIKICDCGGLYATENLETFAGKPCYCQFPHTTQTQSFDWNDHDPSKRDFLKVGGLAIGGFALGVGATAPACSGPSVGTEVAIAQSVIASLKVLFPNATTLDKVAKLFTDFNKDWIAGKFDSARTVFDNLDTLVTQVIDDLGVNASDRAKFILVTLGATLRAIAALIKERGNQSPIIAARAQATAPQTVNRVNQLADPAVADKLLKAIQK